MKALKMRDAAMFVAALTLAAMACTLTESAAESGGGDPTVQPPTIPPPTVAPSATPVPTETPTPIPTPTPDAWGAVVVPAGGDIQIAVMGDVSGSVAWIFVDMQSAIEMALDDYGPVDGFGVSTLTFDEACSSSGGATAGSAISANAELAGVIGPMCSVGGVAALPMLEASHIVTVSGTATRPNVVSFGPSVFNRTILHEGQPGGTQTGSEVRSLPSAQDFYERFEERFGFVPPEQSQGLVAYTYDATIVLLSAIDAVAAPGTDGSLIIGRQGLANAVRQTTGISGATGAISIDTQGNRLP